MVLLKNIELLYNEVSVRLQDSGTCLNRIHNGFIHPTRKISVFLEWPGILPADVYCTGYGNNSHGVPA